MPEVTDWSKARRNPYVRGRRGRVLDADLAKAFPDSASVNAALVNSLPSVPSYGRDGDGPRSNDAATANDVAVAGVRLHTTSRTTE